MADVQNSLILVKGKDKTAEITSWRFEACKPVVWIQYAGGKEYPYNAAAVEFYKNPETVVPNGRAILKNGSPCVNVQKVQFFKQHARIIYRTGYTEIAPAYTVKIMDSALNDPVSENCFAYLKQIADEIGVHAEDGSNILAGRYDKIDCVREDSILASFLKGALSGNKTSDDKTAVFPFGFNLSQKQAVDNALNYRLSIVEGPPGTGKTQTILNIIANAVMRGESVAVVSSNNSATANVLEKLKKYKVDFIAAPLGNSMNKEAFVQNQQPFLPDLSDWRTDADVLRERTEKLRADGAELNRMLDFQNELSALTLEREALLKEQAHFSDLSLQEPAPANAPVFAKRIPADKILAFLAEYESQSQSGTLNFFQKLQWKIQYGLRNFKFWEIGFEKVYASCYKQYYLRKTAETDKRIAALGSRLQAYDFNKRMGEYSALSMNVFKARLAERYRLSRCRRLYEADDLWKNSKSFIKDYPVILSTAYSLRSSLSPQFVYDYVVVDEASQVDLATGALALSCAKKAVIVGDLKQLPNVVKPKDRRLTDDIFATYKLPEPYRYSSHSLLSAATELFTEAPKVLLREHYRCHPEIIGFCSRRFYNNELIILTQAQSDRQPLMIYKTTAGNHARGHFNQRQIDVIIDEVIPQQRLDVNSGDVGIVTPYRAQADALQKIFKGTKVKADTADKFQGQERKVMIFSTVDNEIGDFAADPNRLNVAVSRAIDQFIVVTDGNDNDDTSPIHELIGYIQYQNHDVVNSEISSVFDYLYKGAADAREKFLRKHGRISEFDSENLTYQVICSVLLKDEFTKYGVVSHVPLRMILCDLTALDSRELSFASNHLTHVDFLIFSKLTHRPVLVVEVDGFAYHQANEKQRERDAVKDSILKKYGIPIVRFSTVGSGETEKLTHALNAL